MTRIFSRLACVLVAAASLAVAAPAHAQNPFAPVIQVNEDVITAWELQQRQLFLNIVSPANSGPDATRDALIDDRLKTQAVRAAGIGLSDQDVLDGMAEFAGRANLETEEFLTALGQRGVAPETFRDFVANGIAWRELIRARFAARVQISEVEVERALAAAQSGSSVRVLLSEIIMAAPPPQADAVLARAQRIAQTTSITEFASFARRFSATASRGRGGRLDWTPIGNLPPILRPLILGLSPGEVTAPIPIPNAVALFQLRAIEETDAPVATYSAIEYAQFFIPGGRSDAALAEATRIRNRVDVCDDLYGEALGLPEDRLVREAKAPADIPSDIAMELVKLDTDEVSTALVSPDGQSLVFLMMCGRSTEATEDVSRDAVAERLRQQRLEGLAESLLEELRAEARIRDK